MKKIILILILQIIYLIGYGQIPVIETPISATFQNYSNFGTTPTGNQNFILNYNQTNGLTIEQANINAVMQEVQYYEQLRRQQNKLTNEATNELNSNTIQYDLPSFASIPETEYFRTAFNEINNMLQGKKPLDLKRAVFLSENAFLSNQMDYKQFDKQIK